MNELISILTKEIYRDVQEVKNGEKSYSELSDHVFVSDQNEKFLLYLSCV